MWLEIGIDKAYILTYVDGLKVKIESVASKKLAITNEFSENADEFLTFELGEDGEGRICFGTEKNGKKIDMTFLKASMRCIRDCMY